MVGCWVTWWGSVGLYCEECWCYMVEIVGLHCGECWVTWWVLFGSMIVLVYRVESARLHGGYCLVA